MLQFPSYWGGRTESVEETQGEISIEQDPVTMMLVIIMMTTITLLSVPMYYVVTIKRAKLAVLESQRHKQGREKWSQGGKSVEPTWKQPQVQRPLHAPYLLFYS